MLLARLDSPFALVDACSRAGVLPLGRHAQFMKHEYLATTVDSFAFVRRVDDGIELSLKVVPGSSRGQIVGCYGNRLKVRVTAPPKKGMANKAVLALLAQWLDMASSSMDIIAGQGCADKTVKIRGLMGLSAEQVKVIKLPP